MSKELTVQELEDVKQVVCDEVDAISDVLLEACLLYTSDAADE